ncbi:MULTISPECIES: glycine oxidase ThiO [Pseudomonadaceae]|uniref:glycine oxidase ThiO n=1 Tax=Pseudomonadaceae TaxID=135621 RepID=UPI0015E349B0|nr:MULTISPECIES: glycine oxidase ThiO [unclassified Pseudomonas]MBA1279959.1 glycine oxidase ThiO [Stutzerimonas stutzeri]MBC8651521.1 glycine oxidase ThiO [Pseudomonas sp. MT4]QXY91917.1 glycine oxidase ThiO [Pseudomonas sp. MTM4]
MERETIIVGGGVIGLLSAYCLANAGQTIVLLESGRVGTEASWAGGGIVSPLYPWRYSPAITALAHWSQDFYPQLGESLFEQTGIDPEVYETGLYWLDLDDEEEALDWAGRQGRPLHRVPMEQVCAFVPSLGTGFLRAVFMPNVANVRNPRLLDALRVALAKLPNVQVIEHCPVTGFIRNGERILGVETAQGEMLADRVVVAAGAWSGELLATLGLELPVKPMKGQMILFKCTDDFLPSMVLAKRRYAIPRRDGHILVGSTLEDAGFDKTPTGDALESLRATAIDLLPSLADAEVVKHWAGLRPASPEGIPYIGPVPGHDGLWLNCGHFRNGLVLAPASCQLLTDLMLERAPAIDPDPYAPAGRF